jgi:hypothetical protein
LYWLKKFSEAIALFAIAGVLAGASEFGLRCHIEQKRMAKTMVFLQQRQSACLELRWRWEADDQEHQYIGSSAGTAATVGPIAGFVMDVTENEYGHAVGQCHAKNTTYTDQISMY